MTPNLSNLTKTVAEKASEYLNLSSENDLVELIKEDHKPLKELIKTLKSDISREERADAFEEFALLLIAHSKPEEDVLYTLMKDKKELRSEGFEGDVEHQLAEQMVDEARRTTDPDLFVARTKVLAELVGHHIQEEEDMLLPDFKKSTTPSERLRMGQQFLKLKVDYLAAGDGNSIPDPKAESESNDSELHH